MGLSDKIVELRKARGWSQEELAEKLKVSRQAISRWEGASAQPDAANILKLSRIFGVTADYLLNDDYMSDEDLPRIKENKTILHSNLTRIAIIAQAAFLNTAAQPWVGAGADRRLVIPFKLVPLLLASIWMASNHRYESDSVQRAKNTKIELVYCLCQTAIAVIGYFNNLGIWTALLIIIVALIYIFIINPKYMNRKLVKTKR